MRILPVPPQAHDDAEATELVRAWIVDGRLQVTLAAWIWKDEPETWGRLLAETAAHLTEAIAAQTGRSRAEVFAAIRDRLVEGLDEPGDDLVGGFVNPAQ